jgi:hypothetical protein
MGAMLVPARLGPAIADGSVDLLFRRWRRPQALAGHRYRTAAGMLLVSAVDVIDPAAIGGGHARRAGYRDVASLVSDLRGEPGVPVYRLKVALIDEPDPRDVLAADGDLSQDDIHEIASRLDRLDAASSHGPWTRDTLAAIAARPAVRAGDLASAFRRETQPFKLDVRKLKALGLTTSLEVGYRLSPRGIAFIAAQPLT